LREKFLKLSDGKLKECVDIGPQIREIWSIWTLVDRNWEICMSDIQRDLYKFPWKCKSWKLLGTCGGLVKCIPEYRV
jgi:hypothetical protein